MLLTVGPVHAGGSWLESSSDRVVPGEQVELKGLVSRGQLGWVEDGPFYVYLNGPDYGLVVTQANGGTETNVLLGKLTVREMSGQLAVSATVAIPRNTPPGGYRVVVCNDPCTTGLGDLIGGQLQVEPADAEATAVPIRRLSLAPYPDRSTSMSPAWVGMSALLAAAVLVTALLVRQTSAEQAASHTRKRRAHGRD